jgi:AbrB family looped-hinge helix DNA binding protein
MRTTIDRAGRVVIPKAIRDQAGISGGGEVDVEFRDGRIELEPATRGMRLVGRGRSATIEAEDDMPTLTTAAVRSVLEHVRR